MYTELEKEISSYKVDSFKTLGKAEYQQLLDKQYEGFIVAEERPINVMVAVKHECSICGKKFYNRAVNMLGNDEVLQHQCFLTMIGVESDKVRKKRLVEVEKVKNKLRKEMSLTS
ncbi:MULTISPECIES: hypothetical protein [Bacillus cereus group]|uniref:hypothetical protein n=1 Tax=Bacillus cereus group TaxID=86661 RepID=UPI000B437596|nr:MULTISPECIES: hypothetical protein [Bacillus cereus group]OTX37321.1 hypothetical protein BK717_10095 [Bacillus thuringiensis serovar malayensis]OUB01885.1 hypothetical protein BK709_28695 [Bacillus thuringiensis serovar shandongiensis]MBX0355880.1 hypothetical protein [Bacillus toyonensis]MDH4420353.1 hypothetical protein [Bacillus cereus]MDM5256084.1 hypothetical protein [Bacillus toyonensis]